MSKAVNVFISSHYELFLKYLLWFREAILCWSDATNGVLLEIFQRFSELLDIIDCKGDYFLVEKITFLTIDVYYLLWWNANIL